MRLKTPAADSREIRLLSPVIPVRPEARRGKESGQIPSEPEWWCWYLLHPASIFWIAHTFPLFYFKSILRLKKLFSNLFSSLDCLSLIRRKRGHYIFHSLWIFTLRHWSITLLLSSSSVPSSFADRPGDEIEGDRTQMGERCFSRRGGPEQL